MIFFYKRKTYLLISISILMLIIGTLLLTFSEQFVQILYEFLSKKVYHREFRLEKWLPTIESFIMIPIFLVIVLNALIFTKYSNKQKFILLTTFIASISFMIIYATAVKTYAHIDSDLASELLLAKECYIEKTFWPRTWFYSTEIRLLNTQIISAPIFFLTDNWNIVKIWTTIISSILLFFSAYFLLNQVEIKQKWLKLLISFITACPFSGMAWVFGTWGAFYIPHAIFLLIYVSLFLKTLNICIKGSKKITMLFFIWAFISGLSSIRYIMNFVFPLALSVIIMECLKNGQSIADFKNFWIKNKKVFLSTLGVLISGIGYIFNNIVLQSLYSFSNWNNLAFCSLGDIKIIDIIKATFQAFGFQDKISILTPNGIINILIFIATAIFAIFLIKSLKSNISDKQKILLGFFLCSYIFNTFVYINTEFIYRYYYPILFLLIPCLSVIIENQDISPLKRYAVGVIWVIILLTSSYTSIQHFINTDFNKNKYEVAKFLENSNYDFGYATFWNANVMTYLTNGKVEIGNFSQRDMNGKKSDLTSEYHYHKWLTPKRYYTKDYGNKRIFLLLEQEQYKESISKKVFESGTKVFEDDYYIVFEYNNHEVFKNSF